MTRTAINKEIRRCFPHARIKWSSGAMRKRTDETMSNIYYAFKTLTERKVDYRIRHVVSMVHITAGHYYPSKRTRDWMAHTGPFDTIRPSYYIGINITKYTDAILGHIQEPLDGKAWHLVNSPDETLLHELGHIHARMYTVFPPASNNFLHHAWSVLSWQASFSPDELYAELFAARVAGTSIPDTFSRYMESIQ